MFFEVTVKNHDTGKLHRFTDCVCGTESENRAASYENAVETGVIPKDWTNYTLTMKAKRQRAKRDFLFILEKNLIICSGRLAAGRIWI